MQKETEEQILEELKNINQSLENINERDSNKKTSPIMFLLTGFLVVAVIIIALTGLFEMIF